MRLILILTLLIGVGIYFFKRYYKNFPPGFKGWLGKLLGLMAIAGWIYLLLKIR